VIRAGESRAARRITTRALAREESSQTGDTDDFLDSHTETNRAEEVNGIMAGIAGIDRDGKWEQAAHMLERIGHRGETGYKIIGTI
jgi:hypothetical protein